MSDLICSGCGMTKHPAQEHPFCNKNVGGLQGGVVGGHLGSPTPEQEGPDLIGEIVLLSQKIADLETAKSFHMACIENLVERLKDVERTVSGLELNRLRGNG